ncbi:hypothetical protein Cgig2_032010 [Carnegiea gigantea]|uniref:Non-structural maintenance of chromosomes element 4 n=1 Tax=Carnegiea gigantea TaxID=171969 RepID=A0A9Q1QC75_9CARY|nr:hypothetical protein Cgig2_032010 [Carnegiea gigantea]
MARGLKRHPLMAINENRAINPPEIRAVKREKVTRGNNPEPVPAENGRRSTRTGSDRNEGGDEPVQGQGQRRVLRSQYLAVKTIINEEKEELCKGDSDKLQRIIRQVDDLYEHVQKPREQVADAEALLDIAATLVTTVKSHSKDGLTPSDFISSLIHEFGGSDGRRNTENERVSIKWKDIGVLVSPIFKRALGCSTMIGPMNTELRRRKVAVQRRRGRQTGTAARPEQLDDAREEEKTDTDKNMATMFNILRRKKSVRLENLILNRSSFAQTVENLFALSFLVKDGRAEISVDDKGNHRVAPRNAPPSNLVLSGEVMYNHFVFRFDFKDWKLMMEVVPEGEELMPHRHQMSIPLSEADQVSHVGQVALPASPSRKVSRRCG